MTPSHANSATPPGDETVEQRTWQDDDSALLTELAEAADLADPVPPGVLEAARSSLTWLRVDAEIAELLDDSGSVPTGVRSERGSRLVSFAAGGFAIDLEVIAAGKARRLIGQMSPASAAEIQLRHAGSGAMTLVAVDHLGRFMAEGVQSGLISLVCTPPAAPAAIATTWIRI